MRQYFCIFVVLFLTACSNTNFVNLSMPNFKSQVPTEISAPSSGIKISIKSLNVEQNNNYSDYFENSILKIRMEKEIELLKQNLEEQMKIIAKSKGYEVSEDAADYKLETLMKIYIEERDVKKTSEWLRGDFVDSKLDVKLEAKMDFIETHNPQNKTNISSNMALDSLIALSYPVKSDEGVSVFKTSLSTVPTQLNRGLEHPAFEIDKAFIAFYKNTINSLNTHLPKAENIGKAPSNNRGEYNEFEGGSEGVVIFE